MKHLNIDVFDFVVGSLLFSYAPKKYDSIGACYRLCLMLSSYKNVTYI